MVMTISYINGISMDINMKSVGILQHLMHLPIHHLIGEPYYVSIKVWKDATKAYRKGIATQEQLDMLKFGHYIQE